MNPALRGLSCFACELAHDITELAGVCRACGMPLRVDYDFAKIKVDPADLVGRVPSLFRYREVLPVREGEDVTLVEGWTPLLPVTMGAPPGKPGSAPIPPVTMGAPPGKPGSAPIPPVSANLWVKDEARNPTGSFKARGMAMAVSMARLLGAKALSAPSAGNAAGALAAYGAAAKLPVTVAMPEDTPRAFIEECRLYGAAVHLVPGTIADAGKWLREHGPKSAFDISTLREPYRVEGKKTMAYELFEQMGGDLPDVILYPTGGGTGLIGMWKAFDEMTKLGWLPEGARLPRLVSVQAEGCAPVVKGFDENAERTAPWPDATTRAYGLRVPSPLGGFLCLRALRETLGTAIAVPEASIEPATRELAARTGIDICPEGGAAWAALGALIARGVVSAGDRVVLFNTGTGLKYRG